MTCEIKRKAIQGIVPIYIIYTYLNEGPEFRLCNSFIISFIILFIISFIILFIISFIASLPISVHWFAPYFSHHFLHRLTSYCSAFHHFITILFTRSFHRSASSFVEQRLIVCIGHFVVEFVHHFGLPICVQFLLLFDLPGFCSSFGSSILVLFFNLFINSGSVLLLVHHFWLCS